ncbi:hypothetical protein Hanom_Chr12g01113471 [Helianthus anomalus]
MYFQPSIGLLRLNICCLIKLAICIHTQNHISLNNKRPQRFIHEYLKFAESNPTFILLNKNVFFSLRHLPHVSVFTLGRCFPSVRFIFHIPRISNF